MGSPPPSWPTWHPTGHISKFVNDPVGLFSEAHRQFGSVVRLRMVTQWVWSVSDPSLARTILVDHQKNYVKRSPGYTVLERLLGKGLVTAEGDDWKRKRRIANPAFHRRCLDGFVDTMNQQTAAFCEQLAAEGPSNRDAQVDMVRLTLCIAGLTLFHVDLTAESDDVSQAVRRALGAFHQVVASSLPMLAWLPTKANREMKEAVEDVDRVVQDIISGRRNHPTDHTDLLAMLMAVEDEETGSVLNDRELRDEVVTTLLAGHETTANALAWAFWLLAGHAEVREKVAAELDAVVPEGPIDLPTIDKLPYLRATVREVLRLYPPVWLLARRSVESDQFGDYTVPAGTVVFFSPWVLHRDPTVWPNPEDFEPQRFVDDYRSRERPACSYLPFSTGARKCIGDRFAEAEMAVVLGWILRRFTVERTGPPPGFSASVTLGPAGGVPVRFLPRETI